MPREYLFFVDLKKAFDSIDRGLLLRKLKGADINDNLVMALRSFYDGMSLEVDGEKVKTNIGVVQGGITSPLTFNLIIDDLIQTLNKEVICLALADDIVIHAFGDYQLQKIIKLVKSECAKLGLTVSDTKSAVMEIQRGKRPVLKRKLIYGFPSVTCYKYLGIKIQNNLKVEEDLKARKDKCRALKK